MGGAVLTPALASDASSPFLLPSLQTDIQEDGGSHSQGTEVQPLQKCPVACFLLFPKLHPFLALTQLQLQLYLSLRTRKI